MQQATAAKPDEGILWVTLGDAQLGGGGRRGEGGQGGRQPRRPILPLRQKYTDAAASYKKGVDLNAASKKPSPEAAAAGYNQLGQAYGKRATRRTPPMRTSRRPRRCRPTLGCTTSTRRPRCTTRARLDGGCSCRRQGDCGRSEAADAYYIKGQALIPKATVDPKTQKIVAPPGLRRGLPEYLELAPDGSACRGGEGHP